MSRSYEFVFGTRPWRLWHMLHIAMLLPILWFADYFSHFVPGAGPQGGEAVLALMLAYMLGYLSLSAVNAILLAVKGDGSLFERLVKWPMLLLVAWIAAVAMVLVGAEIGTASDSDRFDRWAGVAACVIALAVYYGANFAALKRARRA